MSSVERDAVYAAEAALGELLQAMQRFGPMNSAHEGWAVIREEVDELWEAVKANDGYGDDARNEALQVAAMAMRYVVDVTGVAAR